MKGILVGLILVAPFWLTVGFFGPTTALALLLVVVVAFSFEGWRVRREVGES